MHLFDLVLISFHLYLFHPRSFCGRERSVLQVLQGPGLTWLSFRFRSTAIACHGAGSAIQSRMDSKRENRFSLPIDSLIVFPHEMAILPGHNAAYETFSDPARFLIVSHRPASRKIKRAFTRNIGITRILASLSKPLP